MRTKARGRVLEFATLCAFIGLLFYFFLGAGNLVVDTLEGDSSKVINSSTLSITNILGILVGSLMFSIVFFFLGLAIGLVTKRKARRGGVSIKTKRPMIIGAIIGSVFLFLLALGFVSIGRGVACSVGDSYNCKSFWTEIGGLKWLLSILPFVLDGAFAGAFIGHTIVKVFGTKKSGLHFS